MTIDNHDIVTPRVWAGFIRYGHLSLDTAGKQWAPVRLRPQHLHPNTTPKPYTPQQPTKQGQLNFMRSLEPRDEVGLMNIIFALLFCLY